MQRVLRFAVAALALLAAAPTASAQQTLPRQAELIVGEKVAELGGWKKFCEDYKPECDTKPVEKRIVLLDAKAWRNLQSVNTMVNNLIKPMTDYERWGTRNERYVYRNAAGVIVDVDKWDYAEPNRYGVRYGDCDEYVLVKRQELMRQGWPRSALLITVVKHYIDVNGEKKLVGHAVLTVRTTAGDLILDNFVPEIKRWSETDLQFMNRQSEEDPNTWLALSRPNVASAK